MAVAVVTVAYMMAMIEKAIIIVAGIIIIALVVVSEEITINIAAESIIKIQVDGMITTAEVQNIHQIIMTVVVKMVQNKIIQDTSNVPTDEQSNHQVEIVLTLVAVVVLDINSIQFHHGWD